MSAVVERAHAKLNVFLRVLGLRQDGYHDIATVVLPLALHDVVTVEFAEEPAISVTGPRADELARAGGESLCARAVAVFEAAVVATPSVAISIEKRIPVGAGMGGGSADAAAVLRALARMHDVDPPTLHDAATRIGSDVPALLRGGPVLAEGRGERLIPVHAATTIWVVVPQRFGVPTREAYGWWDEVGLTGQDPGALIAALETGALHVLGPALYDDLEDVVTRRHPAVARARERLIEAGALGAVMTGSGPTVVGLAANLGAADRIAASIPGAFVTAGPPATMGPPSGVV